MLICFPFTVMLYYFHMDYCYAWNYQPWKLIIYLRIWIFRLLTLQVPTWEELILKLPISRTQGLLPPSLSQTWWHWTTMLQWNYWWRRIPLQVVAGKEYQGEAAATFNVKISSFAHLGWISAMTPSSVMSSHQKLIGIGLLMISTRTETLIPIGLPILSSIEWGSYWRTACCSKHAMNRSSAVIPAASRTKNIWLKLKQGMLELQVEKVSNSSIVGSRWDIARSLHHWDKTRCRVESKTLHQREKNSKRPAKALLPRKPDLRVESNPKTN